jgi:hypothetical protein
MRGATNNPSWWATALQPRYLAGLGLAILAAVIFALLANWQWSRTLTPIPAPPEEFETVALEELIEPGGTLPAEQINRPVKFVAQIDLAGTQIISGRRQLIGQDETEAGYWLVANSIPSSDEASPDAAAPEKSLTIALYFSAELDGLLQLQSELSALTDKTSSAIELDGVLAAPEGPRPLESPALRSLSLAQLVNLYSNETLRSYPAVVIASSGSVAAIAEYLLDQGVQVPSTVSPIRVRYLDEEFEINWLTAFYAVEWLIFAVIAFYIWWRLVSDARSRAISARLEKSV